LFTSARRFRAAPGLPDRRQRALVWDAHHLHSVRGRRGAFHSGQRWLLPSSELAISTKPNPRGPSVRRSLTMVTRSVHLSISCKQLADVLFTCIEREVSDENVLHSSLN